MFGALLCPRWKIKHLGQPFFCQRNNAPAIWLVSHSATCFCDGWAGELLSVGMAATPTESQPHRK